MRLKFNSRGLNDEIRSNKKSSGRIFRVLDFLADVVPLCSQISQLFKIGSQSYEDMKQFSMCIEESLFRLSAHRDRALNYKMEEVQITAVDELYVEQSSSGVVEKQIARVRLFFLGFLSGKCNAF